MLQQYFGFNSDPFGTTPDPRCLYYSHTHREALASLKYGFYSNRGFTALIASPGMGKTTLLFRFLTDIKESARSVFLFDIDTQCQPQELAGYILRDIGITPGRSNAEVHEQLDGVLVTEARAGRRFVVVIDEAQNLSEAVLEKVRLLTNFETPRAKLMQIVLAGQPQLSEKLMQPSLAQLRQRISIVCRLEPFLPEEIGAYINHRLKLAGYSGETLFTESALNLIVDASHGIPRTINNLCFNSLTLCCALKCKQVSGSMVADAVADLQLMPQSKMAILAPRELRIQPPHRFEQWKRMAGLARFWAPAVATLIIASVLGAIGLFQFLPVRSPKVGGAHSIDLKVSATPVPTSATARAAKTSVDVLTPQLTQFKITVELHQTLGEIALRYLGDFDQERLHQIRALNPKLIDPNHIEPGEQIWLPASPKAFPSKSATTPAMLGTSHEP
jgi:general secretion pathway protein A